MRPRREGTAKEITDKLRAQGIGVAGSGYFQLRSGHWARRANITKRESIRALLEQIVPSLMAASIPSR